MDDRRDVELGDSRVVRVHDTGAASGGALTLFWHHGSPQTGALLAPLRAAAAERGIRLVSCARPGYGGSSPLAGRDVASVALDVAAVADALGIDRFAAMGASGGGPHALACAALLPDRVVAAVTFAGIAPYPQVGDPSWSQSGSDTRWDSGSQRWFEGMAAPGALRAARSGRDARERFAATEEFDPTSFTAVDWAALEGTWASLGQDAGRAAGEGGSGLVDDDLAFVAAWGFDVAQITVPVLVVQGEQDRVVPPAHAEWLGRACRAAQLWTRPGDGHVSVLDACPAAMDWLLAVAQVS